jgi:hypothetical protein
MPAAETWPCRVRPHAAKWVRWPGNGRSTPTGVLPGGEDSAGDRPDSGEVVRSLACVNIGIIAAARRVGVSAVSVRFARCVVISASLGGKGGLALVGRDDVSPVDSLLHTREDSAPACLLDPTDRGAWG